MINAGRAPTAAAAALLLAQIVPLQIAQAQSPPLNATETQDGSAIELPPVSVTERPSGSLTVPGVEQQRQSLDQTAGSVGWVDSESYRGTFSNTLRDVLKNTPGVYVETRYGQELRLSIRGSGIARSYHLRGLELLQDGIPVNLADGSGDFYQLDPLAFRTAEVFRGGNGLAYGSSTLGGAIDFINPTAYTAIAPDLLRVEAGSFGSARINGQMSRVFGDFDALGNLTMTHSDGFRNHSRQDAVQFNANAGYRINPNLETRFYVGSYDVWQQLPGSLTLNQALRDPTMAAPAAVAGNQSRVTHTQRVANRTTISLETGKLDVDTWLIHKSLFHPIFQVVDQDGFTYGTGARYTASLNVAGFRNDVIAGARFFGGNNTALQYVNLSGSRGAQTLSARQDAYNYETYFENRFFFLPDVALMLGGKGLINDRNYVDEGGGLSASRGYTSLSKTYSGFNPKLGLLWEPRKDVQLFADITRSMDVPDFSDLVQTQVNGSTGFVPLADQRAWTVEVGTRGRTDRFSWDVTAYRSLVHGQLLQFNTSPNLIPASTFNAGNTVVQGVELGVAMDVGRDLLARDDRLTFAQIWNYTDAHFSNDPQYGRNKIAGLPPHVFRSSITYAHPSGVQVTPTLDVVPVGMFADYANTVQVPAYMLVGMQAEYETQFGALLYVDARNLANTRYISDLGTVTNARATNPAVYYPGDGRSVFAGVRFGF